MSRKTIKRALGAVTLICLILISGYFILNALIRKKIGDQFENMSPFLLAKFSKVHANILSASVSFDSLSLDFTPYGSKKQNKHHLYFSNVSIKGISFLKFVFNKKLEATDLLFDSGNIQLDSFLIEEKDSAQSTVFSQLKWPCKKLYIGHVELKNAQVSLHSENSDHQIVKANVSVERVSVSKASAMPSFSDIAFQLSGLNYKSTDYDVRLSNLSVSSRKKELELDSLQIVSTKDQDKIAVPSLRMSGFEATKLLSGKILVAKHLNIDRGKIVFFKNEGSKTPGTPFDLKKIDIDNIQLKDLSAYYRDKSGECYFNADASLNDADIDSSFNGNNAKFGSIQGSITHFVYSGNNYLNVEIQKIDANSSKEMVQINGIHIKPRIGKYEYGKKLGHQADWMQAYISKVDIVKPDFEKLLHKKLFADTVRISESNAYIFRDRRLPRPQENIPLPVDIIKSLPVELRIKTCELATSMATYEEYPRSGYGATGVLRIEKLNLRVSPLINHPIASDPAYMTMIVEGSMMGSGTTHGVILMPLQKNKPYYVKGAIEKLELTKLNSSSENLGKIRIKSGFLDFLSFDFAMTEERSTGKIVGAYHHLIIEQLKKHTSERNVADVASFALRHAIIPLNKDASLPERKRTGRVDYQRDPTRLVSYYFLQSLLMGVKKSFTLGFLLPK